MPGPAAAPCSPPAARSTRSRSAGAATCRARETIPTSFPAWGWASSSAARPGSPTRCSWRRRNRSRTTSPIPISRRAACTRRSPTSAQCPRTSPPPSPASPMSRKLAGGPAPADLLAFVKSRMYAPRYRDYAAGDRRRRAFDLRQLRLPFVARHPPIWLIIRHRLEKGTLATMRISEYLCATVCGTVILAMAPLLALAQAKDSRRAHRRRKRAR